MSEIKITASSKCSCGTGKNFGECCGPLILDEVAAETPEALMRSRYTAFILHNIDYLHDTHDPQTRTAEDMIAQKEWADSVEFMQLQVHDSSAEKNQGRVEFTATFVEKATGKFYAHREKSKFRKQAGQWYFREGRADSKELAAQTSKVCDRCGTSFTCGADAKDCWCFAEKVDPNKQAMIESKDCLCPSCLGKIV